MDNSFQISLSLHDFNDIFLQFSFILKSIYWYKRNLQTLNNSKFGNIILHFIKKEQTSKKYLAFRPSWKELEILMEQSLFTRPLFALILNKNLNCKTKSLKLFWINFYVTDILKSITCGHQSKQYYCPPS